jgi:hypothetical protein
VLKGRYTAIIISILAHLLFIFLLIQFSPTQPKKMTKLIAKKAIKSYLYRPVIVEIKEDPVSQKLEVKKPQPEESLKTVALKKPVKTEPLPKLIKNKLIKSNKKYTPAATKRVKAAPLPSLPTKVLSPQESLRRLRENINQQATFEAFKEYSQIRTATVMDGEQIPVPHSVVPLTVDEKHKQNTSTSNINSITKHDNGTCTIVREQMVGSDLEGSISSFACGESKFDKSFRLHMEKVRSKLLPSKK